MLLRVAFFVLMALGLTGFGAVAWLSTRPPAAEAAAAAKSAPISKKVMVTARAIRAGSLLKPEDLVAKEISLSANNGGITVEGPDAQRLIVGALVRRGLGAGETLRNDDIMRPGEHGFLAAVLEAGSRGITLGVDATTGSAGLIWPGDRVDVILTQSINDPTLPIGRRVAAETVLRNTRVIAIDQQMVQGESPGVADPRSRTVTLEVSPEHAERLSVAMRLGRLSLSLVAAGDGQPRSDIPPGRAVWANDVSAALGGEAPPPGENVVRIFRGAGEAREFKF
jgi:pilus assembly protein CpaB